MPLVQVDLSKKLEPLDWFIPGLFLRGYINMLASLPGQGKTAMLTGLAWQASRPGGGEFLGEWVAPGASIYVDYDAPGDGRSVRFWLEKHRAAYPDGDLGKVQVLEPDPDTYGLDEAELDTLASLAKETGASLIILDSFMAAFPNTNPIQLTAVQGPLWFLRRLATDTNAAVVVVDHLPKPMSGEKAGARGVMGSVAKPAQARAVHVLTRVPKDEVQGRTILRWDVQKMTFGALPEPFGIELRFQGDALFIDAADLPEGHGETKSEQAIRVMQGYFEERRGQDVARQELLAFGREAAGIGETAAKSALKTLLERLGDSVVVKQLPERGRPVVYRLKGEQGNALPASGEPVTQICLERFQTQQSFGQQDATDNLEPTQSQPQPIWEDL